MSASGGAVDQTYNYSQSNEELLSKDLGLDEAEVRHHQMDRGVLGHPVMSKLPANNTVVSKQMAGKA